MVSGTYHASTPRDTPLLVCIHGGGCNGRYFELSGNSLVSAAQARGFPVLVLDRPGYAGNATLASSDPISETAPLIRAFVDQVRDNRDVPGRPVALIGHSIGGALAMAIAADRREWPLVAIAVSGIGDESPLRIRSIVLPDGVSHVPPAAVLTESLFHDPERTLEWRALASLRAAAEDWLVAEVREVVERWPLRWRDLAARVDIPVHLRLAEHERIWASSPAVVARMASAFSPRPAGGCRASAGRRPSLRGNQIRAGLRRRSAGLHRAARLALTAGTPRISPAMRSTSSLLRSG
jgi:pimeloyl-ACP methyl ester carboxylesterase